MTETMIKPALLNAHRGFLPIHDPARAFPESSQLSMLDEIGRDLPHWLEQDDFHSRVRQLEIPHWPENLDPLEQKPYLRLYYLRLGFLASAYINQTLTSPAKELPANIAQPLVRACRLLGRPPILSYDGYVLYNWYRLDKDAPIELGNIDTIQNFIAVYDEHWFILIHLVIEAIAESIINAIITISRSLKTGDIDKLNSSLLNIAQWVNKQCHVLQRIPEHMDSAIYFKTIQAYTGFFENIQYQNIDMLAMNYQGQIAAQSSIMPSLIALMKIPHKKTPSLTGHLLDMRKYMPRDHRLFIEWLENMQDFKSMADKDAFNQVLQAMANFHRIRYGWAEEYANQHSEDSPVTASTAYMPWLEQLIDKTLAHRK
ncbi:MAG: hypothetical protein ACN4GM_10685 [Gammaproteobacteria bacterium]